MSLALMRSRVPRMTEKYRSGSKARCETYRALPGIIKYLAVSNSLGSCCEFLLFPR